MAGRRSGLGFVTCAAIVASIVLASPAAAHKERPARFPDGSGHVPTARPLVASPRLVVCKPDSAGRIRKLPTGLRAVNRALLKECGFSHVQAAVDAVTERGTTIYLLPGVYREEPSRRPPSAACQVVADRAKAEDDRSLTYEEQQQCSTLQNLIGIYGDGPDDDFTCDGRLCDLQIEGTGRRGDVVIEGGFDAAGDWAKLNGIRADRADGFVVKNFTIQLFEFNAVYVLESDGFLIDGVLARWNDEYGFLTFAVDHGKYYRCEGYGNGDSTVYPGSASDLNADNPETGITRWAVEVSHCKSHHNALGYSGTAGNSVYVHDSEFYANSVGMTTDSLYPDHPGLPQDHGMYVNNKIYGNNVNYIEKYVQSGICARKPRDRGIQSGTVCPVIPTPVGTGMLIAGGNHNLMKDNAVYDNWRQGFMLFWVPAALRNEPDPALQYDTSHHNHYVGNRMGFAPGGLRQPNGLDFWWDDEGSGNCWQGNTSASGPITHNAVLPLPDCDSGGSVFVPGVNLVKSAQLAPCSAYNRDTNPDPAGCDWFDTPPEPAGRQSADTAAGAGARNAQPRTAVAGRSTVRAGAAGQLAATGSDPVAPLIATVLLGLAIVVRRRLRA